MSALTILRAASRDVANEREVMEAIDALAEAVEALESCAERLAVHMNHTEDLVAHMEAIAALTRCGVPA